MNNPRMELLAPAGDREALIAAVQNGADAVYLGTGAFNARRHAGNFDGDGLRDAVDYCHARGVKVHVTLNTLVRQDELPALEAAIRLIAESGADAVIVQDFGVARALRQMAPEIALHASTQMAAHNPQAARFLKAQGFDRVVLAREATFEDMAACAACGVEVEVFVHGALCVACSGQCLMSSLVGGRSGNRGLCAQPCRLPWRLDGREGYLLSTRDLCAIGDLPRLARAGVTSLKIEGRMKRAEYVAVTVAAYRQALDALESGASVDLEAERADLGQMFNRGGFTRGYGPGMAESDLMYPRRPNHIGAAVGECRRAGQVALSKDVDPADALVLRGMDEDTPVKLSGRAGETVRCPQARPGDALIRLVSEAQMRAARQSYAAERRQTALHARAELFIGQPARLTVATPDGARRAQAVGAVVEAAQRSGLNREAAARQLSKTGGTPYRFDSVEIAGDDGAFAPASMLNALRRDALAALAAQGAPRRECQILTLPHLSAARGDKPLLLAQACDGATLRRALDAGADGAIYCPDDLRNLSADGLPETFALAVPAVLSGEALDALNRWALAQEPRITATYLTNVGQLGLRWPGRRVGGAMLNVGNDLSIAQLNDWGVAAVVPSVELTAAQIGALGGEKQLIVWGRLPLMHLRHCPLRAAEGMKGHHADCRHCDGCAPGARLNGRALVDRKNAAFPLHRVAMPGGCVVQVLNSVPLMPLRRVERLPAASAWLMLLRADEPVEAVIQVYRAALDGRDFRALDQWNVLDALPATTGHYFRGVE